MADRRNIQLSKVRNLQRPQRRSQFWSFPVPPPPDVVGDPRARLAQAKANIGGPLSEADTPVRRMPTAAEMNMPLVGGHGYAGSLRYNPDGTVEDVGSDWMNRVGSPGNVVSGGGLAPMPGGTVVSPGSGSPFVGWDGELSGGGMAPMPGGTAAAPSAGTSMPQAPGKAAPVSTSGDPRGTSRPYTMFQRNPARVDGQNVNRQALQKFLAGRGTGRGRPSQPGARGRATSAFVRSRGQDRTRGAVGGGA